MEMSNLALDLVKHFESCFLTAYYDSGGVLTIGWGHTGSDVYVGQTITQEQADKFLEQDIKEFVDDTNSVITRKLTQSQFDAVVSFSFNTGHLSGKPTLTSYINNTNYNDELLEMMRYTHDELGNELDGLIRRRKAECYLYWYGKNDFYPTVQPPFDGSPSGGDSRDDKPTTGFYKLKRNIKYYDTFYLKTYFNYCGKLKLVKVIGDIAIVQDEKNNTFKVSKYNLIKL